MQLEEKQLEFKKKIHIRFLKLMHDESVSKFACNPIMNKRYLLLNLLGKGGFSEVWKVCFIFCVCVFVDEVMEV